MDNNLSDMDELEIPDEGPVASTSIFWKKMKNVLKEKSRKVWTSYGVGRILLSFLEHRE